MKTLDLWFKPKKKEHDLSELMGELKPFKFLRQPKIRMVSNPKLKKALAQVRYSRQTREGTIELSPSYYKLPREEQGKVLKHELTHVAMFEAYPHTKRHVHREGSWFNFFTKMGGGVTRSTELPSMPKPKVQPLPQKPTPKPSGRKLYVRGKPAARVIWWTSPKTGKAYVPQRSITDIRDIPKGARDIEIVEFDEVTREPLRGGKLVTREELARKYTLVS